MRAVNLLSCCLAVILVGSGLPVEARVWRVPQEAPTIQAGVDSAAAGDVVVVASGTYFEHDIFLKSGITLRSATGSPHSVTVDAREQGRVFYCQELDASTRVEGLTITGGSAYDGAGMYCTVGTVLTITRCHFLRNRATWAAGLACVIGSAPAVSYCVFAWNTATKDGGGAGCSNSAPTFTNCTFVGNHCGEQGSAVFGQNRASPTLDHCLVAFNQAEHWIDAQVFVNPGGSVALSGCNLFDGTGGEWTWLPDQAGADANFTAEPGFCGGDSGDYYLCADSPCLPGVLPNGQVHGLVGALGQGCADCGPHLPPLPCTWGALKEMYR